MIAVTLLVDLVGCLFCVALDYSVKVFQTLFLVGSQLGVVESGGVVSLEELLPRLSPFCC